MSPPTPSTAERTPEGGTVPPPQSDFIKSTQSYQGGGEAAREASNEETLAAQEPDTKGGMGGPEGESSADYRVFQDENGKRDLYQMGPDGAMKHLGAVDATDAQHVLDTVGTYNENTKSWDITDEKAARSLSSGGLAFPEALAAQVSGGNAGVVRAYNALKAMNGEMTWAEAAKKNQEELVKTQLTEAPAFAWSGLGKQVSDALKHPADAILNAVKLSAKEAASFLPMAVEVAKGSAETSAKMGGGALLAATATGTLELPPVTLAVGRLFAVGATAGAAKTLINLETGGIAASMMDQGHDKDTIKLYAPIGGAIKASLWMVGFKYLPGGDKVLSTLAGSEFFQKAAANWLVKYGGEVTAGTTLMVTQEKIRQVLSNMAATAAAKPELLISGDKGMDALLDAGIRGAAGMGLMAAPGAMLHGGGEYLKTREEKIGQAKTEARIQADLAGKPGAETLLPTSSTEGASAGEAPAGGQENALPAPRTGDGENPQGTSGGEPQKVVPLPDSVAEHPAFVKSVALAEPHLGGIDPADKEGVIAASNQITDEHHDFRNEVSVAWGRDQAGLEPLAEGEKQAMSEKMKAQAEKMLALGRLAKILHDPETALPYFQALDEGRSVEGMKAPVDPYDLRLPENPEGKKPTEMLPKESGAQPADRLPQTSGAEKTLDAYEQGHATPKDVVESVAAELPKSAEDTGGTSAERAAMQEKTVEVAREAAVKKVDSDITRVDSDLEDLYKRRRQLASKGAPLANMDRQINALLDHKEGLLKNVADLKTVAAKELGRAQKLEMTGGTLADAVDEAFKKGGDEAHAQAKAERAVAEQEFKNAKGKLRAEAKERVDAARAKMEAMAENLKSRPKLLKEIAAENGLTGAEVRKLLKDSPSTMLMSDRKFAEFVENFKAKAEYAKEWKAEREKLQVVQDKQNIQKENYVRKLHDLPPVKDMTIPQLQKYADILAQYDANDTALPPSRVKALETTRYAGAKTANEVLKKEQALTGRPLTDFKNVAIPKRAAMTPDPHLVEMHPVLRTLVEMAKVAKEKGNALFTKFEEPLDKLAADAIASRRKQMSLGQRLIDVLAPQQKEMMAFVEEKDPAKKAELGKKLTPEEHALLDHWELFRSGAQDYLQKTGELEKSRFGKDYLPHVSRSWPELLRELPEKGLKKTLAEFMPEDKNAAFADAQGNILGLRKFFKQTLFRTGELEPSKNIVEAMRGYADQFYRKVALDEMVPTIDTLVRATGTLDKTESGKQFNDALQGFVKDYLNNKKGINNSTGIAGELAEPALRFAQAMASIKYIALNIPLQATVATKEAASTFMALGGYDYAAAKLLKRTAAGQAILEKYSGFVGKGPIESLTASSDLKDYVNAVGYGTFSWVHKTAMEDVLLGSMTKEEIKAQTISPERLAQIELNAGRWLNLHDMKSVVGSSAVGSTLTQLKGWAVPPLLSIAEDAGALAKTVTGKGKLNPVQSRELLRLGELAVGAVFVRSVMSKDMEDDSFVGQAIRYTRRDIISVFQALEPKMFLSVAVGPELVFKIANDLTLLLHLEEYKNKEGYKGVDALSRDLTPAMLKQFKKKEN